MKLLKGMSAIVGGGAGRAFDDASPDHYKVSHVGCNCDTKVVDPEDPWRKGFTRRSLIKGGGYLMAAPLAHQMATTRMAFRQPTDTTQAACVVAINVRGGWDGLNIVVPHGDPVYADARPNIAVPRNMLLKADNMFGLNPGLGPLMRLWDEGRFAVVHGAALEEPEYSHFQAMVELEMGTQRQTLGSGWGNRVLDQRGLVGAAAGPLQAVQFGGSGLPTLLRGTAPAVATGGWGDFRIYGDNGGRRATAVGALNNLAGNPITGATQNTLRALESAAAIAAEEYQPAAQYPGGGFGEALQEIARTIKAGVGLQLASCDIGGWDTHTQMGRGNDRNGNFNQKVADFATALGAFCDDLGALLDDVLIVVVSEFGRRIQENSSNGTDHGYGQPMFVIGGGVNGGRYYANDFALDQDERGSVARGIDYREVIAECLLKRGGIGNLDAVFPAFQYGGGLGLVRGF